MRKTLLAPLALDGGKTWNDPDHRVNESSPAGVATGANADVYCSYAE